MKNKKETAPTTEEEREDFWLEIGPASAYYGTDSYAVSYTHLDVYKRQARDGSTT